MSKIIFLFLCISLFLVKENNAQKKMYFPAGVGLTYHSAQDFTVSPLVYRGLGANIHLGFIEEGEKYINRNMFKLSFGYLLNTYQEGTSTLSLKGDYSHIYVRKINNIYQSPGIWYLGGNLLISGVSRTNFHITNVGLGYDISQSLGISNWFRYPINMFNRDMIIDAYINIPFISYIIRPGYTGLFETSHSSDIKLKDFIDNGHFVSFGNYVRLNSSASLTYLIKNGNALMLTYEWDYYSFQKVNPVQAAQHCIYFTTLFRF